MPQNKGILCFTMVREKKKKTMVRAKIELYVSITFNSCLGHRLRKTLK